jgi:hypothetical protein
MQAGPHPSQQLESHFPTPGNPLQRFLKLGYRSKSFAPRRHKLQNAVDDLFSAPDIVGSLERGRANKPSAIAE